MVDSLVRRADGSMVQRVQMVVSQRRGLGNPLVDRFHWDLPSVGGWASGRTRWGPGKVVVGMGDCWDTVEEGSRAMAARWEAEPGGNCCNNEEAVGSTGEECTNGSAQCGRSGSVTCPCCFSNNVVIGW